MIARSTLVLVSLAACGEPAAHVQLLNVDQAACGQVAGATHLDVTAYGSTSGVHTESILLAGAAAEVDIADFPEDTIAISVSEIGNTGSGAVPLAIGKTGPITFDSLAGGTTLPIFMAPPNGFCRTMAPLVEQRFVPLVARAGAGVLVVGGDGTMGPLSTAEYYDPQTSTFSAVDVPSSLVDGSNGLHGGVLTELPDGRVVLTGTASHAIAYFDPTTREFSTATLFPEHRAYHGAFAPDAQHVFLIGGCPDVATAACSGPPLHTSFDYLLADLTMHAVGPILPDGSARIDATIFDIGLEADGRHIYALAGGSGDPGAADRFAIEDSGDPTQTIMGLHAQVAALDGGALLTAFEADGVAATGAAAIVSPGGAVQAIANSPLLDGARLALLEDGTVAAIGGDPAGHVTLYTPTSDAWTQTTPGGDAPGPLTTPVLVRLDDGSLLVLGGSSTPTSDAWIFRPSLVGPQSASVDALSANAGGVVTPTDPSTVTRDGEVMTLTSTDASLDARALVGGIRLATGSVTAAVRVHAGGVALIARQLGPAQALVAEITPGAPVTVVQLDGTASTTVCTGTQVPAFDAMTNRAIGLVVSTTSVTVTLDQLAIATCSLSASPPDIGSWGIASLGPGAVDVVTITVARQ